ncbi:three component ABC system middle component [uncultured Kordia sp.]|uniref:three component ABC system middle component n=1 Tax=uncultured Kordia sp. TaxID=507699 RepID=UPI0026100A78|nr:three component ABC system middle component [uncultured Kordia sp.]
MNKISIDVFAETNPAFCSLIIFNFCKGYHSEAKLGVPFPLLILPLPLVLSYEIEKTFRGTNIKTGFFRWIENNPEIQLNLTSRINESNEFLKPAIEFAIFKKTLHLDSSGLLIPIEKNVGKNKSLELESLFKSADRLGKWLGQVNSIKTIYNHLGLQL